MTSSARRKAIVSALGLTLCSGLLTGLPAVPVAAFSTPTHITVEMWELNANGSKTPRTCSSGHQNLNKWGCTAYCDNPGGDISCGSPVLSYPWTSPYQNPVTVEIEGTAVANRYLRDVIPQEMGPAAYHPTAIGAQAIAARTFAYYHIQQGSSINNSTQYQAFIPRKYDTLTASQKASIDVAVQNRYYLSRSSDDLPILAQYFEDIPLRTLYGGQPYLLAVEDPISSHPDVVQSGHGHGLSQKGAGRWARGNLSYNINNDLGAWSVSWPNRTQILTHYYTAIHVRDAGSSNAIQTPNRRFDVLWTQWARPSGYPTGLCSRVDLWLHNTGTSTWSPAEIGVGYCWGATCTMAGYLPRQVLPGKDLLIPLTVGPGAGYLYIDLYYKPAGQGSPTWFGSAWPRQFIGNFTVVRSCRYLPAIERGYILAK